MVGVDFQELIRAVLAERQEEMQRTADEIRRMSGEQREQIGRAILHLRGKVMGEFLGKDVVKFSRKEEIRTKIKAGDVVLITTGHGLRPSATGTVMAVKKHSIDVATEFAPWMKRNARIDLYVDDTTFRRWLDVLRRPNDRALKFMKIIKGGPIKRPKPIKYTPVSQRLDRAKLRAVALALGAEDVFLIHGPFGTGKTTALAELVVQEVKRGRKVLATAETNVAVDNLVEKLHGKVKIVRIGNPVRVSPQLQEVTLYALVKQHKKYRQVEAIQKEISKIRELQGRYVRPEPRYRRGLSNEEILALAKAGKGARGLNYEEIQSMARWIELQQKICELRKKMRDIEAEIVDEVIRRADVVLTTNSSAALEILPDTFDVAVIDEAAQATIPSVLIPVSRARKIVMAGDHRQLPPTIISKNAKILEKTAFELIIERQPQASAMLEVQYRMNETLARFPSEEFYGGAVKTAEHVKNIDPRDLGLNWPRIWMIDTSACKNAGEMRATRGNSYYNPLEASIVTTLVNDALERIPPERIGVITPYDAQRDVLVKNIAQGVEVNTVDGFQGREKDLIIISAVRSNPNNEVGFLRDRRRLNVMLTRAKRALVIVGDSQTLKTMPTYSKLLKYIDTHGKITSACDLTEDSGKSR